MEEVWKNVEGFKGLYKISNFGNVLGITRNKQLKLTKEKDGYFVVSLSKNNHKAQYRVHRLVASAFIPNPCNFPSVNHRDGIKTNNNVNNLEWCTTYYNNKYNEVLDPLFQKGERAGNARLTAKEALEIFNLAWEGKITNVEIGKIYGVNDRQVANIKYGEAWKSITHYIRKGDKISPTHPRIVQKSVAMPDVTYS